MKTESAGVLKLPVGEAELLLVPEDKLEPAKAVLSGDEATGENSASIDAVRINVTVKPAPLTIMYVAGQSNAEGWCSANTGYRRNESVACTEGKEGRSDPLQPLYLTVVYRTS